MHQTETYLPRVREGLVLISSMESLLVADSMKSQPSRSKYPCFFSKMWFDACNHTTQQQTN